MGFGGEVDGRGLEAVRMVLWMTVVETVREDFWGVVEDDVMTLQGGDDAAEGVKEVSEALGGLQGGSEGGFEEELRGTEAAGEEGRDPEH